MRFKRRRGIAPFDLTPARKAVITNALRRPDPDIPCGYCCSAGPLCGSSDPEHEDMTCEACAQIPLSEPHAECLVMVEEYVRTSAQEAG